MKIPITEYNLTPKAKKALKDAESFAEANSHSIVRESHLFYGCLTNLSERYELFFQNRNVTYGPKDFVKAFKKIESEGFFTDQEIIGDIEWDKEVHNLIDSSKDLAEINEDHFVGVEHLIKTILDCHSPFVQRLIEQNPELNELNAVIEELIFDSDPFSDCSSKNSNDLDFSEEDVLEGFDELRSTIKYCVNMNQEVFIKNLPPVVARDEEIAEMIEVLSKKGKSNVLLVGDAGVGKTAIVEGLVQKIVMDQVPTYMSMYRILSVDVASMLAGTQYRGQFEERFDNLIKQVEKVDNTILFFDEIHTVIGAGNSNENGMDASNMLKPALARGSIKCIGATTTKEYKEVFEKSSAFNRRFDKVEVNEPSKDKTREMLEFATPYYEEFHGVKFSKRNIETILDHCETYLSNKKFPDKAFDVIDQVGARVKIKADTVPDHITEMKDKFTKLITEEPDAARVEEAVKDYIKCLTEFSSTDRKKVTVSNDDILEIFESKSGIPKKIIGETNRNFSLFKNKMKKEIFGQDKVIDDVYEHLSCAKVGLNDPNKPLANFLFVGPTSVGKTHTAKNIAKYFYGSDRAFIQINMGEYQDKTGIAKLIGANAGYVGYDEGGLLTEFVRSNPNAVVLFDEIEKADPKILDLLLHLLDEGYVSDNLNRKIDFSKSVVVLTTNIGNSDTVGRSMGFVDDKEEDAEIYQKALKKTLRPELISRINSIHVFDELGDEVMRSIISKEISFITERLKKRKVSVRYKERVTDLILNKIKSKNLHARSVKALVKKEIQTPIAKFIIENKKTSKISLNIFDKELSIS